MKILLALLVFSCPVMASDGSTLPPEGGTPEQERRRQFVHDSIEIHCAGTDRRLAALKRRYAGDPAVMSRLAGYEVAGEGHVPEARACIPAPIGSL